MRLLLLLLSGGASPSPFVGGAAFHPASFGAGLLLDSLVLPPLLSLFWSGGASVQRINIDVFI